MPAPRFISPPATPPPSKGLSLATGRDNDLEGQRLIGTTRFEPRSDVKNILITGGAGFIGGWVTRHLAVQYPEYNIVCFDKLDVVASLSNISCLQSLPNFEFVHGDLMDQAAIAKVLSEHNIDCVMHFAACSHVQNSFNDPLNFTVNNVIGTQLLLEAIRHHKGPRRVHRFIHVSTDEVYGDVMESACDETKQFMPTNPYAASKAAAEMYVWSYAKSFDIPALVVRSNNVYGPGQYPEKIIPRFCTLLMQQRPLTIQGSGMNIRRYLYGADAADGFDTLLHKGVIGEAYNIQSSQAITNLEVAARTLELFGYSPRDFNRCLTQIPDRPFNDHDYWVDGSKLAALGWQQRVPFSEGLEASVKWYRENLDSWWPEVSKNISVALTATPENHPCDTQPNGNGAEDVG
ncbi:dTDP-D-glucose 4-6-dehydratase-like protein [Penicillium longicatenatum]|uniref:dTDP-D-glucose 4-6-dehydratase-like protein n=1 Tax=Penicillium longicatenatum TaxID=1561947 RepID=UPI0025467D87|nr:dTDP-D-glucose 4-6-dehydratase-like protein [Penicillium longicatenatum]KAJ5657814.1 dTDP-D-glucose 4-6-dehydratase-like protein [Penicillium longicatenatum]